MFVCKVNEGCKLAIKLHSKLSILRHEPDLFDELTNAFGGLEAGVLIIEGFGEIGDLLAIELGKVRMQTRHGRGRFFEPSNEFHSPGLQDRHLVLDGGAGNARFNRIDYPANLTQYLADGITEELITGLAKVPEFMVMARNSTLAYKDKPTDIRQVGKDLNVRYVVEGTIQRFDQNVCVTAQLIDASTGRHLWADRYDREATGIFAVRDDITRSIAGVLGGLQGEAGRAEAARLSAKSPRVLTVYDYVMKGWYELYKYEREANKVARDLFEQAKKIDPSYARTYAGLAWTYADDFLYEWTDDHDKTLKRALENASTAVRLDPNDYHAHWVLGWAHLYSWEHEKALASYLRARSLNPNDAELLAEMGSLLIYIGQPKQAIDQVKEAIRLNPYHEPWYTHYLGWAYENYGMPREAIETLEPVIDEPPTKDSFGFCRHSLPPTPIPWLGVWTTRTRSSRQYCRFNQSSRLRKLRLGILTRQRNWSTGM